MSAEVSCKLLTLHSLRECARFECRQSREDNYHCSLSRISTDFYMRYVELHRHEFLSLSRSIHRQHMHKTGLDFRVYIYIFVDVTVSYVSETVCGDIVHYICQFAFTGC